MEIDFKSIVLYFHKKGLSPQEILNDINETLGPNRIVYSTITKYIRASSFSPRKCPIENNEKNIHDEENQILIKKALDNFPFASVK